MLRDLLRPSRITERADVAIEALQGVRHRVVDQVNAMAALPFDLKQK